MSTTLIYYADAIREALRHEMKRDEKVVLLGEDIALYGGSFGVTRGLFDEFGAKRVVNTPISEGGFTGVAVGAALTGLRPVVEYMFMDFIALASDQIVNHGAKFREIYGEQAKIPIVFRAAAGAGRSYGATHSQMLEGWFMHIPGLKVVAPAFCDDAYGLLISAIRDDNPVLVVEHKDLYKVRMPFDAETEAIPFGLARTVRSGSDVVIFSYSKMVHTSALAAVELEKEGISAEVIDLRSLRPLDRETIGEAVSRCGKAVIVTESMQTAGPAAEIMSVIMEEAFDFLDAPVIRISTKEIAIPFAPHLEKETVPTVSQIVAKVKTLF